MKIVNFQRHPLVTFFILTFVWSWGCWSYLVATTPPDGMQAGISPVFFFLAILGGYRTKPGRSLDHAHCWRIRKREGCYLRSWNAGRCVLAGCCCIVLLTVPLVSIIMLVFQSQVLNKDISMGDIGGRIALGVIGRFSPVLGRNLVGVLLVCRIFKSGTQLWLRAWSLDSYGGCGIFRPILSSCTLMEFCLSRTSLLLCLYCSLLTLSWWHRFTTAPKVCCWWFCIISASRRRRLFYPRLNYLQQRILWVHWGRVRSIGSLQPLFFSLRGQSGWCDNIIRWSDMPSHMIRRRLKISCIPPHCTRLLLRRSLCWWLFLACGRWGR